MKSVEEILRALERERDELKEQIGIMELECEDCICSQFGKPESCGEGCPNLDEVPEIRLEEINNMIAFIKEES